jgi:hypothetical protein
MIWGEFNRGDIRRANLDGTGETPLVSGLGAPQAPVLDLAGGQMYWTNWGNASGGDGIGYIQRANLDGTGLTTLVTGLSYPNHVAVDIAGGKMYLGNNDGNGIQRANLDGSGLESIFPIGEGAISWITLDVVHGKLYWTSFGGRIERINLDGSRREVILSHKVLLHDLVQPIGIALDVARGQMYSSSCRLTISSRRTITGCTHSRAPSA